METLWTRRRVLQALSATAIVGAVPDLLHIAAEPLAVAAANGAHGTHLYARVAATTGTSAGLGLFSRSATAWELRQFLPAPNLQILLMDKSGQQLYAAHRAPEHPGACAGHVESCIDPHTSFLRPHVQTPLALSARMPEAMALSPDGTLLVVAAIGGTFSLVPIAANGKLAEITAVHKQLGNPASRQILHMSFAGPEYLLVREAVSVRAYTCRSDGMRLIKVTFANSLQDLEIFPSSRASSTGRI